MGLGQREQMGAQKGVDRKWRGGHKNQRTLHE
jgi:hypothetical protein